MSRFTDEQIKFLEENVKLNWDVDGVKIDCVRCDIVEVMGTIRWVWGDIKSFVWGNVEGKINGKKWRFVDE